jgi:hypothetical protein
MKNSNNKIITEKKVDPSNFSLFGTKHQKEEKKDKVNYSLRSKAL